MRTLRPTPCAARKAAFWASLTLAAATGCGVDPHREPVGRQAESAVVLASKAELDAGAVLPKSYIVTFRNPVGMGVRGFGSFRREFAHYYAWLADEHLADPRVVDLNYISAIDLSDPRDTDASADFEPPPALRLAWDTQRTPALAGTIASVDFASDADAAEVLKEWEREGRIWFAEPNYANELPTAIDVGAQQYADQKIWWHEQIKLGAALSTLEANAQASLTEQVVAVLDSGLDVEHPALAGRIWVNPSPGSSQCEGDVHGCDVTEAKKGTLGHGNVFPYRTSAYGTPCDAEEINVCQHGTHVAGIIAAKVGSDVGGVCPVCKIMAIKIIKAVGGKGIAADASILNGLKYLTRFKKQGSSANLVRVANASFGKYSRSRAVALLVSVLKRSPHELLVVGAAGNEDSMQRSYPAALTDALAVAGLSDKSAKASYSNFGPWVDIAAPGGDDKVGQKIISTVPGGMTGGSQGTSMAAPVVAGAAALVLATDPGRNFAALRSSLLETADPAFYSRDFNYTTYTYYYPQPTTEGTRRPLLGSGILDVQAAIANSGGQRPGLSGGRYSRVDGNCGTLGRQQDRGVGLKALLWLGLIVPLVVAARRRANA